MPETTVDLMVEGGKATAGPQMGQSLAPLGVNIQDILKKINEKTSAFKGMKVPVKVIVDTATKKSEVEVGSPPISELIKGEISIDKGSGEPNKKKIANLSIEQVIKLAKMKRDSMLVNDLKSAVKSVIGSCNSTGVIIEGKNAKEINEDIENGIFDKEIKEGITETPADKKTKLASQLKEVQQRIEKELAKEKAEKEAEEAEKKKREEAEAAATVETKKEEPVEVKETKEETKEAAEKAPVKESKK